jgi:hypothetical protein
VELADVLWGNLEDLEGTLRARGGMASQLERNGQPDDGRIVSARLRKTLGMNVGADVRPTMTFAGSRQTGTGDVNEAVARVAAAAERGPAAPLRN